MHSLVSQFLHVALRRRVLPHHCIHCRRDQDGRRTSEVGRSQKIIGHAVREFGNGVGGSRRDYQEVNGLRERYVCDWIGIIGRIIVHDDVRTRECAEGEGLNELTGVTRHRHPHVATGALQAAQEFDALISGNAPGYAKADAALA